MILNGLQITPSNDVPGNTTCLAHLDISANVSGSHEGASYGA